ncbi:unnamed protein product [Phyllotreta striolata]|uniref:Uncharacterized protein n=1 Tax=Phyllotreta striolata TaxID=444603 RepID=A0A9P0GQX8_PHYSR|nr:unnamed protein product [Phyllotreta striolata]
MPMPVRESKRCDSFLGSPLAIRDHSVLGFYRQVSVCFSKCLTSGCTNRFTGYYVYSKFRFKSNWQLFYRLSTYSTHSTRLCTFLQTCRNFSQLECRYRTCRVELSAPISLRRQATGFITLYLRNGSPSGFFQIRLASKRKESLENTILRAMSSRSKGKMLGKVRRVIRVCPFALVVDNREIELSHLRTTMDGINIKMRKFSLCEG